MFLCFDLHMKERDCLINFLQFIIQLIRLNIQQIILKVRMEKIKKF